MSDSSQSQVIRQRIVRRFIIGFDSYVRLECGHEKNEYIRWAGSDVLPGERARCWDCELLAR